MLCTRKTHSQGDQVIDDCNLQNLHEFTIIIIPAFISCKYRQKAHIASIFRLPSLLCVSFEYNLHNQISVRGEWRRKFIDWKSLAHSRYMQRVESAGNIFHFNSQQLRQQLRVNMKFLFFSVCYKYFISQKRYSFSTH
jgi:hypothetical protein